MTIQLIMDNDEVPVKYLKFSDGASTVKLEVHESFNPTKYCSMAVSPTTSCDSVISEIGLVANSICHSFPDFKGKILIHLPYLPYARGDRVFEKGNAHPLETFLSLLAGVLSKDTDIYLTDPHSDVYEKADHYFNFVVKPQHECFREVVRDIESCSVLVSPDKGALNKIYKLQNKLEYAMIATKVIEAGKKRDPSNGRILETFLPQGVDLTGKVVYIVDDICDAGGTFIPLAEKLREAGAKEVHLYVTHGIFAKGLQLFKGKVDKLHVYQTVGTYVNSKDILDFNNGLEVK